MGVILGVIQVKPSSFKLLPRYGGYSGILLSWLSHSSSCFPVMGVILLQASSFGPVSMLLPRYGGYSTQIPWESGLFIVASPLWGLFHKIAHLGCLVYSCFPVMGVIPKQTENLENNQRLLPRYGGYSTVCGCSSPLESSCFPVMGVILSLLILVIFLL